MAGFFDFIDGKNRLVAFRCRQKSHDFIAGKLPKVPKLTPQPIRLTRAPGRAALTLRLVPGWIDTRLT